ncbi:MAG: AsmA family protein [Deltaproteobacteria bacterium]|jgi:AsmA protein|nr:AsmA family protein [Deltaproteobacteria bacterium]
MKKIIKIILCAIAGLILLLVTGLGIALLVIDPNDYREEISLAVRKATGRQLSLNGPIGLKILPRLAVSARDVSLAQAEGFGTAPLLRLDEIDLRMAILPLFTGSVQVDAIILNGLALDMLTSKQGKNNWEIPGEGKAAPAAPEAEAAPQDAEAARKQLDALLNSRISEIRLENCVLSYKNDKTGQHYILRLKQLLLDEVGMNRDIALSLNVEAEERKAGLKGSLSLAGALKYMLKEQEASWNLNTLKAGADLPPLEGTQQINGNISGRFNLNAMEGGVKAQLKHQEAELALDMLAALKDGLKAEGNLALNSRPLGIMRILKIPSPPADNPALRTLEGKLGFKFAENLLTVPAAEFKLGGEIMTARLTGLKALLDDSGKAALPVRQAEGAFSLAGNPRPYLQLAGVELRDQSGKAFSLLESGLKFSLRGSSIALSAVHAKLDGEVLDFAMPKLSAELNLRAGAALPLSVLESSFSIKAKPRILLDNLGALPATADAAALRDFSLASGLHFNNYELKLPNLSGALDQTSLKGSLEAKLPGAKSLPKDTLASVKSVLQLGILDADRYMPPADKSAPAARGKEAPAASKGATQSKGPLQGSPMEKLLADITLDMRKLTVQKVPLENISLRATLEKGVLRLSKAKLNVFGGEISSSATAALAQPRPHVSFALTGSKLDINKALLTLADEKRLSGLAGLNLNMRFSGLDVDSILSSLDGTGDLAVKNGALGGLDLIPAGAPANIARFREPGGYKFNDFGGSFKAAGGKLINDHLELKGGNVALSGSGSVAMLSREIDYKGVLTGKGIDGLPLTITGPLNSPRVSLDQEALVKMATQKAAEKALQELQKKTKLPGAGGKAEAEKALKNEAKDRLNKEAQRGLDRLFKR